MRELPRGTRSYRCELPANKSQTGSPSPCYTPTLNLQYTPQVKETPLAGTNTRSAYSRSRPAIASEDRRLPSSQCGKTFLSARPLAIVADAVASRVRCGNLRVVTELQLGLAPPLRRKEDRSSP